MPRRYMARTLKYTHYRHALLLLIFLMSTLLTFGQYSFPKPSVLALNGIRTLTIKSTPLRYEDGQGKELKNKSVERKSQLLMKYFFDADGRIDSVYHYPTVDGYHKKDVLRYDELGRLVEVKVVSREGRVTGRTLVERAADGGWYSRTWEHGALKVETKMTADSIMYETIRHSGGRPPHKYGLYTYDLEQDKFTRSWFNGKELIPMESHQWIAENGVPKQFIHENFEGDTGGMVEMPPKSILKVDSAGNVLNKLNGLLFDPFRNENYFTRHPRFGGIRHQHDSFFKEDSLIREKELTELHSFDGTMLVKLYEFVYE